MKPIWFIPLLLLFLLIAPASAMYNITDTNIPAGHLSDYPIPLGSDVLIAQIELNDLSVPSNTSFLLNAGGTENYYIWLNLTRPYAGASVRAG